MNRKSVFGLGQDASWLRTLKVAENDEISVQTMICRNDYLTCLDRLPAVEPDALLLIDSNGQPDLVDAVRKARKMGWRNVIVVADAPNWHEAYRTIHDGGAADYWIGRSSTICLRQEILTALRPGPTDPSTEEDT